MRKEEDRTEGGGGGTGGCVKMEPGVFPLFYCHILQMEGQSLDEASFGLVALCPCFTGMSAVLRSSSPEFTSCPF